MYVLRNLLFLAFHLQNYFLLVSDHFFRLFLCIYLFLLFVLVDSPFLVCEALQFSKQHHVENFAQQELPQAVMGRTRKLFLSITLHILNIRNYHVIFFSIIQKNLFICSCLHSSVKSRSLFTRREFSALRRRSSADSTIVELVEELIALKSVNTHLNEMNCLFKLLSTRLVP